MEDNKKNDAKYAVIGIVTLVAVILLIVLISTGAFSNIFKGDKSNFDGSVDSSREAKSIAQEYVEENDMMIASFYFPSEINSYTDFDVASSEVLSTTEDNDTYYTVVVRGNFYAKDDYGNSLGKFNFDAVVEVDVDGDVRIDTFDLLQ